jgi:hypothetical protein
VSYGPTELLVSALDEVRLYIGWGVSAPLLHKATTRTWRWPKQQPQVKISVSKPKSVARE